MKANVFMSMFLLGPVVASGGCLDFKVPPGQAKKEDLPDMAKGRDAEPAEHGATVPAAVAIMASADLAPSPDMATAPTSCTAAGAGNDVDVVLYIGGDQAKPWTAFCHADKEYLSVPSSAMQNFSQYTAGGATPGTNIVTQYSKIRIDPVSLKVDVTDTTFATSTGFVSQWPSSMTYATAVDCMANSLANGVGHVDLTGTPFAVAVDSFHLGGDNSLGVATYSNSNQIVSITGGGSCGWNAPSGVTPNSPAAGWSLQLTY
jgi:hypothetical protein